MSAPGHREIVAGRGRKIRWTMGLLRPYRTRIIFMVMAVIASTAAFRSPACQCAHMEASRSPRPSHSW